MGIVEGSLAEKVLPDGRLACLVPMTFGKVRLCVGPAHGGWYDEGY